MDDLIAKQVDVLGSSIMAAKDAEGSIWVGINSFCQGLDMNKKQRDWQVEKIKEDKTLSRGCRLLPAAIFDTSNEAYALRLDFIPIWLAKISITKRMEQDHPELADKLLEYQLKAKDILADAFLPKQESTGDVQGQIKLLAQGTTELYQRVETLEDRIVKFEEELPLFPEDADVIKNALNKKVVEYLGGKDSNAYRNKGLRGKMFIDAYRELKRNFDVSTYKSIKRNQKKRALEVIGAYKPPAILLDQIQMSNAQQRFEM